MLLASNLCLGNDERLRFWHGLQVLGWYAACCEPRGPGSTAVVLRVSDVDASWPGLVSSFGPQQGVGEVQVQTSTAVLRGGVRSPLEEVGHLTSCRLISTS